MKRELALLLKAQSQILDTAGKTRSNRVPCSDNNGSTNRKRVKRTTADDSVVKFSVSENDDSKSEISSSKERFEDKCLPIANADVGLMEDIKKTGSDITVKARSNKVRCAANNGTRSSRRVKRMTLDDPMLVDSSVPEDEDPKSEISNSKEFFEDQCLSIQNSLSINTETGSMQDLKKSGMEAEEKRIIVLGLRSCDDCSRQVNQCLKNEEEAKANGELKVSADQLKPLRRFTRSILKSKKEPEDLPLMENSKTIVDEADKLTEAEQAKSGEQEVNVDPDLPGTPKKTVDMDDSRNTVIDEIPQTIRDLLQTGLLEGYPVYYSGGKEGPVIHGLIKGSGILCACGLCKGAKVVAPSRFGIHAINSFQRAMEKICFKNGRSLKKVFRICKRAKLKPLSMTIEEAIGPLPEKQMVICGNCKDSFPTTIVADVELLCSSCMKILSPPMKTGKKSGRASRPSKSTLSLKSGTPVLARLQSRICGTDRSTVADLTPASSRRNGRRFREHIETPMLLEGSSVAGSSKKKAGKITTKDFLRNRAVFDRLANGTELSYFAHGERLLSGYKQDLGIFCFCCSSVVSASLFEAHAGNAKHKKPYDNIYTSDGLSLHDLALTIRKENGRSDKEQDSLCSLCGEGDSLLVCDACPRAFHRECADVTYEPSDKWYCRYCQSLFVRQKVRISANAIAAGWTEGVDPLEKIGEQCMRTLKDSDDFTFCHLCSGSDFERSAFGPRTILLCDQCEKEYHISCLKEHGIAELNELPHGTWFCGDACREIHASLQVLLREEPLELPSSLSDVLWRKYEQEDPVVATDLSWMLLSGQLLQQDSRKAKVKRLFSQAISVLHEGFGSILTHGGGRDLIPPIVYGRDLKSNRDYSGMYCAILLLKDVIVSVAVFRVFGQEIMELPLVATRKDYRGKGYFQALFGCIENFLLLHRVKSIVLPAAEDAEGMWLRLGFKRMTPEQHSAYKKLYWKMVEFDGIVMLQKEVLEEPHLAEGAKPNEGGACPWGSHGEVGPPDTHVELPNLKPANAKQPMVGERAGTSSQSQLVLQAAYDSEQPTSEEAGRGLSKSKLEPGNSLEFERHDPKQPHQDAAAANCPLPSQLDSDCSLKVQSGDINQSYVETAGSPSQSQPDSSPTLQPADVQFLPDKSADSLSQFQLQPESSLKSHVADTEQPSTSGHSDSMPESLQRIQKVSPELLN